MRVDDAVVIGLGIIIAHSYPLSADIVNGFSTTH